MDFSYPCNFSYLPPGGGGGSTIRAGGVGSSPGGGLSHGFIEVWGGSQSCSATLEACGPELGMASKTPRPRKATGSAFAMDCSNNLNYV